MRFTVKKLQHDLTRYLGNTSPAPFAIRTSADGRVHAVYTVSTKTSVAYVRLTAHFSHAGVKVDLDVWALGEQGQGVAGLLCQLADIKNHIVQAMVPHTVEIEPQLTRPLSRAVGAAASWLEARVSSAF